MWRSATGAALSPRAGARASLVPGALRRQTVLTGHMTPDGATGTAMVGVINPMLAAKLAAAADGAETSVASPRPHARPSPRPTLETGRAASALATATAAASPRLPKQPAPVHAAVVTPAVLQQRPYARFLAEKALPSPARRVGGVGTGSVGVDFFASGGGPGTAAALPVAFAPLMVTSGPAAQRAHARAASSRRLVPTLPIFGEAGAPASKQTGTSLPAAAEASLMDASNAASHGCGNVDSGGVASVAAAVTSTSSCASIVVSGREGDVSSRASTSSTFSENAE
jgi:hypothetical protein